MKHFLLSLSLCFGCLLFVCCGAQKSITAPTDSKIRAEFADPDNYEIVTWSVGQTGTKVYKIWANGTTIDKAILNATQTALYACMFTEIVGVDKTVENTPAICNVPNAKEDNMAFLEQFFSAGGDYLKYVKRASDAAPYVKLKKGYRVNIVVQIMYDALRQEMINQGMATALADGQVQRPIVMVIPSDSYCDRAGATTTYISDNGLEQATPDYGKVFRENEQLRLVISQLSKMMERADFPLKDMEQNLKYLQTKEVESSLIQNESGYGMAESPLDIVRRNANPDIIMDLDFSVHSNGPRKYISYNLRGIDAYSNKMIAAVSGDGKPSSAASVGILLEEAVLNHMDGFYASLQDYFSEMQTKGREIVMDVQVWSDYDLSLDGEIDYQGETVTLSDVIDYWMSENCVGGVYTRVSGSSNVIRYEQLRIPLKKTVLGKEKVMTSREFTRDLGSFLKKEFGIPFAIEERGLGETRLILGE